MTDTAAAKPILVFTYGNPSRGDDALGPALFEMLDEYIRETGRFSEVDLLTDFQLQIEHAVDLLERERVLFVDASLSCTPPYDFYPLTPEHDLSYTTHAISPEAVLCVYQQINRQPPPPAFMLSIRGYEFGLGQPLSPEAQRHLEQGFEFTRQLLFGTRTDEWLNLASRAAG